MNNSLFHRIVSGRRFMRRKRPALPPEFTKAEFYRRIEEINRAIDRLAPSAGMPSKVDKIAVSLRSLVDIGEEYLSNMREALDALQDHIEDINCAAVTIEGISFAMDARGSFENDREFFQAKLLEVQDNRIAL